MVKLVGDLRESNFENESRPPLFFMVLFLRLSLEMRSSLKFRFSSYSLFIWASSF